MRDNEYEDGYFGEEKESWAVRWETGGLSVGKQLRFLDDSIFRQVAKLHVPKGFPWADHGEVCAKTLHAGDVVSKSNWKKQQALMSKTSRKKEKVMEEKLHVWC